MTRIHQWLIGAVVIVLIIVAAGYFLAISPEHSHAARLRTQVSAQDQTNQGLKSQIQVLQDQTQGVAVEQARVAAISNELPPTENVASYVRALVLAAKTAGVDLMSITPGATGTVTAAAAAPAAAAPVATASAAAGGTAPSAQKNTTTGTTAVTTPTTAVSGTALSTTALTLSVNGSYFQVQQFLSQLEKLPRATIVTGVTLTPGAPLTATGGAGSTQLWKTLQSSISINIFEAPALAAASPSASPSTVQ
jgi:Tfp pilus assembly protein PilO